MKTPISDITKELAAIKELKKKWNKEKLSKWQVIVYSIIIGLLFSLSSIIVILYYTKGIPLIQDLKDFKKYTPAIENIKDIPALMEQGTQTAITVSSINHTVNQIKEIQRQQGVKINIIWSTNSDLQRELEKFNQINSEQVFFNQKQYDFINNYDTTIRVPSRKVPDKLQINAKKL